MKNHFILLTLVIVATSLISFKLAYAKFGSLASNRNNTYTAKTKFPNIVINEVFPISSDNKDWVELYNPKTVPVSMTNWSICSHSTPSCDPITYTLNANDYVVIVASNYNGISIPTGKKLSLSDNKIGGGLNNSDSVILKNGSGTIIDQMSYGTDTFVFPSPPATPTSGNTLARHPNGIDTDSSTDWQTNVSQSIGTSNP